MNYLTNNKNNGVPKYVWIAITTLIGYLIISSLMDKIEERRLTRKYEAISDQFTKELTQDLHTINKTFEKSMNILQDIPKINIQTPIKNTEKNQKEIIIKNNNIEEKNTLKNLEDTKTKNIKIEMH